MQLTTYLRALRKNWWIILLLMVLGASAGVLRNIQATPVYATTTTFYVSTPGANTSQSQFADQQFAEARANSYPKILTSDRLARLVIDRADLTLSPRDLAGRISGSVELNTITVTATVQDTSKARALRIARAVAVEFPDLVDTLDNRGQSPKSVVIDVLSGPDNPGQVSPRKDLNIALGLAAGLLLGLLIAALRELLDTSVRTVTVAEEIIGKPALGTIPFDSATAESPLIIGDQGATTRAEAMRQIRTNLQFVDVDNPPRVIMVTSSTAVEGKSTTATNLALAFAETDSRVVLVEGDLRRPRVTEYTGIERMVGLSNVLAKQVDLDDVLQPFGERLQVLPSGPTPPNAAAMVGSARMAALVGELRDRFDIVIIDTPPVLPVTDAALLATLSDGVVIVLRHGKVSRVQLTTTCRSLGSVNAPVVGFVLNMVPKRQAREYGGRYDGYYRDDNTADNDVIEPDAVAEDDYVAPALAGEEEVAESDVPAEPNVVDEVVATEPVEVELTEPDVVEPAAIEPALDGPEADEPESFDEWGDADGVEPEPNDDLAELEGVGPDLSEPDIDLTELELVGDAVEPELTESDVDLTEIAEVASEATGPEASEPVAGEPRAVESEVVEPEIDQPETFEPEVFEPDADADADADADDDDDRPSEPNGNAGSGEAKGFAKPPPGARPARRQRTSGRSKSGSGRRR